MRTENVARLRSQFEGPQSRLLELSDEAMQKTLGAGLWSGNELLGHLVGHIVRHNDHHLGHIFWLAGKGDLPDDREPMQPIEELP
jgi:hypothetical protein